MRSQPTLILLTILAFAGWSVAVELETVHEWRYIDYVWESEDQRELAVEYGVYIPSTIVPTDFQKISGDRVLIATPRYHNNPASLSIVSAEVGPGGPLLKPYPSWAWHKEGPCEGITSVNKIFLDKCNRLWIVDSGKIGNDQICPAQILAFDPETDKLIKRVRIPDNLSHSSVDSSKGRLEVQWVETDESCGRTWVYIGDPEGYGLVICDGEDIWRLENNEVYAPDPSALVYAGAGKDIVLELGTSILTIPPPGFIDEDYLLLRPMSSFSDYGVKVEELHNSKTGSGVTYYKGNITLPTQELVRVFSDSGVLVGALASETVVACWYLGNPLALANVGQPIQDAEKLVFTIAAKVIDADKSFEYQTYWAMSNNLPDFRQGMADLEKTNFRILSVNIADLVSGTVCEPGSHSPVSIEDKFFFEYETTYGVIMGN